MNRYYKVFMYGLVLTFINSACTRKIDPNVIYIGHYDSMTGSEATFGQGSYNGVKLALLELNKAGGIHGKQVQVVSMDDQSKNEEARSVITRLLSRKEIIAVIGGVASSRTLAAAPVAQETQIPFVSPSSTNPRVTQIGEYIFRVCFIDPFQGWVMAKFAMEHLKAQKLAILRDVKSDYSVGLADFFKKGVKDRGGEIVSDLTYQAGDIDFKAQLTQIRSHKPDAIFIPGYYTEVGLIARQAKQLGIDVPLLGGDGWDSAKLTEIGQDAVNDSYFSNHYSQDTKDPIAQDFIRKYVELYKDIPDGLGALGYDTARILFEAMARTQDLTPEQIRDELAKTKDFIGVTGKISIDENRDAKKSAVVVKIEKGHQKMVTTIEPE
ncbi:MAG: ABC transporter substrate-binding protein [Bdellovibrionaceae bacterium]|nr:ABC transporter substrate-binding protein [Pseudobdellovibrionaceae bacterium]